MLEIKVFDKIGQRGIIKEDGEKIYSLIFSSIEKNENVTLDFQNVKYLASPFFNFAIGQLYKHFSKEIVDTLISFENLSDHGKRILERVKANSPRYHQDIDYQKIVDDILKQQAQNCG